jgi:prepilin-type N-terminal cleavage/methylation domain-containing protein
MRKIFVNWGENMKYLGNEEGFTLMEVLLATVILAVLSLPIFYNSLQSANNYVSAEKYYKATLDAENIITEVKATLDDKIKGLSGSNIDIDATFSQVIKDTKSTSIPTDLTSFSAGISGLALDTTKYTYQVYLKKMESYVNISSLKEDKDALTGSYKFKHGLNLPVSQIPVIPMRINGTHFVSGSVITTNNSVVTTSKADGGTLLQLEYIADDAATIPNPINISTYELDSSIIGSATKVKLIVRNYNASKIDINLFTNLNHSPMDDTLVSYDKAGAIHVVTNKNTLPIPEYNYAIVVAVTENAKSNKVLVQLTDVYSYVPK